MGSTTTGGLDAQQLLKAGGVAVDQYLAAVLADFHPQVHPEALFVSNEGKATDPTEDVRMISGVEGAGSIRLVDDLFSFALYKWDKRYTKVSFTSPASWVADFPSMLQLPFHWDLPKALEQIEAAVSQLIPRDAGRELHAWLSRWHRQRIRLRTAAQVSSAAWLSSPNVATLLDGYARWHRSVVASDDWTGVRVTMLHQSCKKGTTLEGQAAGERYHEGTGFAGLFYHLVAAVWLAMSERRLVIMRFDGCLFRLPDAFSGVIVEWEYFGIMERSAGARAFIERWAEPLDAAALRARQELAADRERLSREIAEAAELRARNGMSGPVAAGDRLLCQDGVCVRACVRACMRVCKFARAWVCVRCCVHACVVACLRASLRAHGCACVRA